MSVTTLHVNTRRGVEHVVPALMPLTLLWLCRGRGGGAGRRPRYVLESGNLYSADMVQFKRRFSEIGKGHKQQCLAPKHCAQNVWMVKPVASNQGRGIELYSALSNILAHVQ